MSVHLREDLAAYAVDALDAAERAAVEAHLATCSECAALLTEYRRVVELLPRGLSPEAPPPRVRDAILARAGGGGALTESPRPTPLRDRQPWLQRALRSLAIAAAIVVLLAGAALWASPADPVPSPSFGARVLAALPGGRVIPLVGTGQPGAAARLYVPSADRGAELAVAGLPLLAQDRVYQLWFARPGHPTVTGGAFRVGPDGQTVTGVAIPVPLGEASAIAVTEEPAPASPGPTGQHLLDWTP